MSALSPMRSSNGFRSMERRFLGLREDHRHSKELDFGVTSQFADQLVHH
jgi:hypothetical protein